MFTKILIANRGEIAVRIIRTCQRMGITAIAVYSEADAEAPHVKLADEAYLIGKPRVNESYLNIDKILEVAKKSGADAIHPGYGLLSEHAEFANRCTDAGFTFIGPSGDAISTMGNKIAARKEMEKAGVPVVPGIDYSLDNKEDAVEVANRLGYPVMLKASAGGGGIGMQIVRSDEEVRDSYEGNQKRATDFFGDGSMYVEKLIENPRHVEIQIVADHNHHTVHLWERECSIQRRHQKVVEEAPSPFIDKQTRMEMGEAAVKAAQSIGYVNAGTIEFLVDENQNFYFLEMNTRLQVEHPVTEEITGIDLVEEQINIAMGKELAYKQQDIQMDGHAIEVRIYAEDPVRFFPSPGQITKLVLPPESDDVRHELGITGETKVTPFYDPMIAKLIVKGSTREDAIEKMIHALENYHIEGIKTNIPMLLNVISHEAFRKGDTTTSFVAEHLGQKA